MTSRSGRRLSDEDRILWTHVARSVEPLKGRREAAVPDDMQEMPQPGPTRAPSVGRASAPHAPAAVQRRNPRGSAGLDVPTQDKLSKGRVPIEGRVDLHGMTQSQAHALLLSFLRRAHENGLRYVLVITGKGSSSGGDGVLRRSVPAWLATVPFRQMVSAYDGASHRHGGGGALYVRLRRKNAVRR